MQKTFHRWNSANEVQGRGSTFDSEKETDAITLETLPAGLAPQIHLHQDVSCVFFTHSYLTPSHTFKEK